MRYGIINFAAIAMAVVAAFVAVGCDSGDGIDKAGGAGTPVMLRLATPDRAGLPGAKAIERFRDDVAELSEGAIRIKPVYEAAGNPASFDQAVADHLRSGRAEMALIPARAWDEFGVTSLSALQAPFLIRDQVLLEEVVTGELADPMMEGLRQIGVTGLALLPENLRHPFGFARPIVSLRDFAGVRVRAPRSEATYELLRALGAEPVDVAGAAFTEAVKSGSVTATESAFELAFSTLPRLGTGTSNITFFPKVNVLVANTQAFEDLTDEQRASLDEAAQQTRAWVLDNMPSEQDAAATYCRQGGRVTAASPANLKGLERAAQPRYAELERDPRTRKFIAQIRGLAQETSASGTEAAPKCTPSRGEPGEPSDGGHEAGIPDGVYRNRITIEEMVEAGVNEATARDNAGVHTITLSDGGLRDELIPEAADVGGAVCDATYSVSGKQFTLEWKRGTPCTGDLTAAWSLANDELRLSDVAAEALLDRVLWGLKPFRKIG